MSLLWSPAQYARFAGPRLQPGLDLIARVPDLSAKRVVDLGCGTGELTELLGERFPDAEVVGVDSSAQMLEKARSQARRARFEQDTIERWAAAAPVDVLFSNAAFHWVKDHAALFPRLLAQVAEGGAFAVQMPNNFAAPSHALMRGLAAEPPFRGRIALPEEPVLSVGDYFELLSPGARDVQLWETEYLHVLEGEEPVFEWVKGTALLPVSEALRGEELDAFVREYKRRLRAAYPSRNDGRTLFPFRRLFMVARR